MLAVDDEFMSRIGMCRYRVWNGRIAEIEINSELRETQKKKKNNTREYVVSCFYCAGCINTQIKSYNV